MDPAARPAPDAGHLGVGGLAVLLALAASQVVLLVDLLGDYAPVRRGFGRETAIAHHAADVAAFDAAVARQVGGRTIQLHFDDPRPTPASDAFAAEAYYSLNTALWPNRAVVGDGRHIVNDTDTLRAADVLPADAALVGWAAVVTLRPTAVGSAGESVGVDVRPLTRPAVRAVRR